ncbi:bifunctional inhibitor/lipid-transfer protein/seed storage 2S albumin superfamily protein [Artemisia annua]|uniref:Bifunctional inhibitor/lipid-transfer protein/seed storage 2S albumin superfamily protein n=1 Tax=Artemisia annua TaxID=35608 RepID=A0A2U1P5J9_ARTAN|nr:bifunctional inhibitor/lipid-transfer protein/seed storage 2S albumin superfamily protein [Artemisia annua]PWA81044.1 bifunctional inhibitor/lipid-transfer protein/seed storage 2S albumin superfamily protein [Artemisia annua]
MKKFRASLIMVMVLSTILMVEVQVGMADCNPLNLMSCLASIIGNTAPAPDSLCCNSLHAESESCLCSYAKNPDYQKYFKMPGAGKVSQACSTTWPDPNTCS